MSDQASDRVEELVDGFERGVIDRRQLLAGIGALLATAATAQEQESSVEEADPAFQARSLNHVTLSVTDVDASKKFYSSILGIREISRQRNGVNLGVGDSFIGLYAIKEPPRVNHFCLGLDEFHVQVAAERLRQFGIRARVRKDKPEVYFEDPDGITVQLENKSYRG